MEGKAHPVTPQGSRRRIPRTNNGQGPSESTSECNETIVIDSGDPVSALNRSQPNAREEEAFFCHGCVLPSSASAFCSGTCDRRSIDGAGRFARRA
jgi:hypothetical protein